MKVHTSIRRWVHVAALIAGGLSVLLGGCSVRPYTFPDGISDGPGDREGNNADAIPRIEPRSRYGNPSSYVVFGKRYHVMDDANGYRERGIASWYGSKFHGRKTSSGEPYNMYAMTAAHKQLPLPAYVRVTNLENKRSVVVRVNDRGPFHENRIIDMSYTAARKLDMLGKGTALVEVTALDEGIPAPVNAPRTASSTPIHPPAAATASTAHNPRIYLQAGSFVRQDNAVRLRAQLERHLGRAVRIDQANSDNGQVYRVQVGPLPSVEIADDVTVSLHAQGITEPLVVID